jgi:GT2 family glycosyltransferase
LLISVVIPVYNALAVIGACLDSLAASSSEHKLEIILIDDCSRDGSHEYLLSKYSTFKIMRNSKNRGYAYTVNRGIKLAHGEYIFLLNQDTVVGANTLDKLVSRLQKDSKIGIIAPKLLNSDGSLQKSVRRFPKHSDIIYHHLGLTRFFPDHPRLNRWKMADFDHNEERYVEQPAFSAVLVRREVFEQAGLLDTNYPLFFNDVDYCRRAIDAGWKILFTPEAEVVHLGGQAVRQQAMRSIYISHAAFIRYLNENFKGARFLAPNFICSVLLVCSAHIRALFNLLQKPFISKA